MSGTLLSTGGGGWMQLAPGQYVPGVTPAPPPTTYDQWGRPVGGTGLGNLYNAVNNAATQQQMPTNAPNLLGAGGFGSSGYDQWGRQAPPQPGAGTAKPALDPMQQLLVGAIGSGNPQLGSVLGQIMAGVPEEQVKGGGLLGRAVWGEQGGGGAATEAEQAAAGS